MKLYINLLVILLNLSALSPLATALTFDSKSCEIFSVFMFAPKIYEIDTKDRVDNDAIFHLLEAINEDSFKALEYPNIRTTPSGVFITIQFNRRDATSEKEIKTQLELLTSHGVDFNCEKYKDSTLSKINFRTRLPSPSIY